MEKVSQYTADMYRAPTLVVNPLPVEYGPEWITTDIELAISRFIKTDQMYPFMKLNKVAEQLQDQAKMYVDAGVKPVLLVHATENKLHVTSYETLTKNYQ